MLPQYLSYLISLYSQSQRSHNQIPGKTGPAFSLCSSAGGSSTSDRPPSSRAGCRLHPPHDPTLQAWPLEIPRKITCEYPQWPVCVRELIKNPSLLLDRACRASSQFTSIPLISVNIQKSHCKTFQIGTIR